MTSCSDCSVCSLRDERRWQAEGCLRRNACCAQQAPLPPPPCTGLGSHQVRPPFVCSERNCFPSWKRGRHTQDTEQRLHALCRFQQGRRRRRYVRTTANEAHQAPHESGQAGTGEAGSKAGARCAARLAARLVFCSDKTVEQLRCLQRSNACMLAAQAAAAALAAPTARPPPLMAALTLHCVLLRMH